jgi:CysZ protein
MLSSTNSIFSGLNYLSRGARLILKPELRLFVLVPLLVNLCLFIIITAALIQQFNGYLGLLLGWIPSWLDFITGFLWTLFSLLIMFIYGYSFSILTNLIAAPFYGLLAEKTEALLTGEKPNPESLLKMIPRVLFRELVKIWYFVWRGLLLSLVLFILSFFIPPISMLAPFIMFLWGAWCMCIQYIDYPADNHQTPFYTMRKLLGENQYSSLSFGSVIMLGSMIPLANIFILPIAVVGGTIYWTEELAKDKANLIKG